MRINCLGCGFKLDLDEAYDDYDGPVKCFACEAILEIHTEQGYIKAVQQANSARHPSAEEAFERVLNPMDEAAQRAYASGHARTG